MRRKQTLSIFHTHSRCIFLRVLLRKNKKIKKKLQARSAPNVQPDSHVFSSGYTDSVIFPHTPDAAKDLSEQARQRFRQQIRKYKCSQSPAPCPIQRGLAFHQQPRHWEVHDSLKAYTRDTPPGSGTHQCSPRRTTGLCGLHAGTEGVES